MSHQDYSFKVASTIAAYRAVYLSGEDTVAVANTTAAVVIGVTQDTVKDTTSGIPVRVAGVGKLYFNDTLTAGSLVGVDASGRGVPLSDTGTNWWIGVALETVALTGTIADIVIQPGRVSTGGV